MSMMERLARASKGGGVAFVKVTPYGQVARLAPMLVRVDAIVAISSDDHGRCVLDFEVGNEARRVTIERNQDDFMKDFEMAMMDGAG